MAADPASVLTRLAVLQRLILDPVTSLPLYAYDNPPYTLETGTMPLFVNYAGPLSDNKAMGSDAKGIDYQETRQFFMVLYLAQYGQGIEGEKYGLCTPYFDLVYAKFGSYPHLNNLGGAMGSKIISDSGGATVPFANQAYYGIRFVLQVMSRVRRTFAAGE